MTDEVKDLHARMRAAERPQRRWPFVLFALSVVVMLFEAWLIYVWKARAEMCLGLL